jgi:sugar (pentulose or hexulose) kinase
MPQFIGIDVGSSFIKAAIVDLQSMELRDIARVPYPEFLPGLPPGHREVDPAAIMRAVDELLAAIMSSATRPAGVVLCGQMHGFVLVDQRGQARSNYVSWMDARMAASEFAEFAAHFSASERDEVGNEVRPGIALPQLWLMQRRGELAAAGGELTPVSIADFVAGRLCGVRPAMEATQAAAFGALRIAGATWHRELIGKLGLEGLRWPDVRPSGTVVGEFSGMPCYTTAGDQQCALAGALLGDGELSVNIGTGSQVGVLAATPAPNGLQTRPYFDNRLLRTITHIPGGRALSAFIDLLTGLSGGAVSDAEVWRRIEEAVASVPATDVRASIAFYPGPCGHGGFLNNLRDDNLTIGHVFRAVFESMAGNYAACGRRLQPERPVERLVFSGGVARRLDLLRHLTAAAFDLPSRLSPHAEDTLLGLLVLALAWSGARESVRQAAEAVTLTLGKTSAAV